MTAEQNNRSHAHPILTLMQRATVIHQRWLIHICEVRALIGHRSAQNTLVRNTRAEWLQRSLDLTCINISLNAMYKSNEPWQSDVCSFLFGLRAVECVCACVCANVYVWLCCSVINAHAPPLKGLTQDMNLAGCRSLQACEHWIPQKKWLRASKPAIHKATNKHECQHQNDTIRNQKPQTFSETRTKTRIQ